MNSKSNFKYLMSYSLIGVFAFLVYGVAYIIYESNKPPVETPSNVSTKEDVGLNETWQSIYPDTKKMTLGNIVVDVSVADTWPERIQGLSNTPYLPEHVVKLFVFDSSGVHSFWMKEMNYSIDIIWLSEDNEVVHIVEGAAPESYPAMFSPEREAMYVIETADGFVKKNGVTIGSKVTLPEL
jgi:uncharacterized membrane protein (UPF0127 family)